MRLTNLGPVVLHQAWHILRADALFPGPLFSMPGQLPPISLFDVSEHYFPQELAPLSLGFGLTRLVGMLLREVVKGGDEVVGLKAGLATSGSAPPGGIAPGDWSN